MGAVLSSRVADSIAGGGADAGVDPAPLGSSGTIPEVSTLPGPLRGIVEHAYGTGVAEVFLIAAPMGAVAFLAVWFLQEQALGTKSGIDLAREKAVADEATGCRSAGRVAEPSVG